MPFDIPQAPEAIEPGTYTASLERVEEGPDHGYGPTRNWHWLIEVDGKITSFSQLTSANVGPNSAAGKWLAAILRRSLQPGERIDEDELFGTRVLVQMVKKPNGYSKIEAVLPYQEPQQTMPGVPR